ncbi:Sugar lactone lactonase YvrE [Beijerinckiaceae bacterium RH AL1]|nr:hypothetical protein [Beijerinckiaceae bacterium]VVB44216.1 Sugar lactone lactonase YvrE [Beijerinckiaceae bacterium RH CH11]VVB44245.1 Sugar lactone lactonase YvrE [Beijerinckiaceae bacterium RH AL8]VVC54228.1 Sugar lactone lactonase YvrE [Beijerinckiaceae bacterium RH AL1]
MIGPRGTASKPTAYQLTGMLAALLLVGAGAYAADAPIELPGPRAAPESITSTSDGTLYVGSFAEGGVTRIRKGEKPEIWIKPGAYDTRSILGVLADEAHGKLWACSNDLSARGVAGPSDVKGSFVKAFDVKSGALVTSAKLPGDRTLCNDIAIGRDGAAYVTNSLQPDILRLKPGSNTLEVWAHDPQLAPPGDGSSGLDGIAFDDEGNLYVDLFVAAQLFRVDVKDGKPDRVVHLAPSRPLKLTDAIRPLGDGSYLLIEGAGRLDRLTVSGDEAKVDTIKDGFIGPTGATKVGATAWVSEGRLAEIVHPTGRPLKPFKIYPVALPKP